MADEASIVELLGDKGDPIRYTIVAADITKGTLMVLTAAGNRLIAKHAAIDQAFVGILAEDTTAASGITTATVYTNGIFTMHFAAAGATDVGHCVAGAAAANAVTPADANDALQGGLIGNVLETAANDENKIVKVLAHRVGL